MMKNLLNKYFILALFLVNSVAAFSQSYEMSDWFTMRVNHRFTDRFLAYTAAELRVDNNFSQIDRWGWALYGEYRIWSFLRAEAGYELHHRDRGSSGWKFRNRYSLGLTASAKYHLFKFSLRERMQQTFERGNVLTELRTRAVVEFEPRNSIFNPYFSFEIYQDINKGDFPDIDRYRYRPGVLVQLDKRWLLDVFYCFQQVRNGVDRNILGIECQFTF